eukprot:1407127-Pyramimonas_sp.AAC.1
MTEDMLDALTKGHLVEKKAEECTSAVEFQAPQSTSVENNQIKCNLMLKVFLSRLDAPRRHNSSAPTSSPCSFRMR